MNILDRLQAAGCRCAEGAHKIDVGVRKVTLLPMVNDRGYCTFTRGTGRRPKVARRRRPWLRARRRAVRKTGLPPFDVMHRSVECSGCGAYSYWQEHLP